MHAIRPIQRFGHTAAVLSAVGLCLPALFCVVFYTLAERKVMGLVQRRRGPNVVGFFGLLQPVVDGVKLLLKEPFVPRRANLYLFLLSPLVAFVVSFSLWYFVPVSLRGFG